MKKILSMALVLTIILNSFLPTMGLALESIEEITNNEVVENEVSNLEANEDDTTDLNEEKTVDENTIVQENDFKDENNTVENESSADAEATNIVEEKEDSILDNSNIDEIIENETNSNDIEVSISNLDDNDILNLDEVLVNALQDYGYYPNNGENYTKGELRNYSSSYLSISIDEGSNANCLAGLEYIDGLEDLSLYVYIDNLNYAPVNQLNNLSSLYISQNVEQDISPLANNQSIKYLDLYFDDDSIDKSNYLETLSSLTKLKRFTIKNYENFDFSCLANLKELESVSLDKSTFNPNEVTSMSWVNDIENLESLSIRFDELEDDNKVLFKSFDGIDSTINISINCTMKIDVIGLENNTRYEFDMQDFPYLEDLLDEDNRFYNENLELYGYDDFFEIDNDNKKIYITPNSRVPRKSLCYEYNRPYTFEFSWSNSDDDDEVDVGELIKNELESRGVYPQNGEKYTKGELRSVDFNGLSFGISEDTDYNGLEGIQYFRGLDNVYIYANQYTIDYSPLTQVESLNYLYISQDVVQDLTSLNNSQNITYLELSFSYTIIDGIEYHIDKSGYYETISSLTNLNGFSISNYNGFDFSCLSDLENLENLSIYKSDLTINEVENMNWINQLENLKSLQIGFNNLDDPNNELLDKLDIIDSNVRISINGYLNIDLGNLDNDTRYEFNYSGLPYICEYIDENSRFYNSDFELYLYNENLADVFEIDNENNKFYITPNKAISRSIECNSFRFTWSNPDDDEIVVLDDIIKQSLLSDNISPINGEDFTKKELRDANIYSLYVYSNDSSINSSCLSGIEYLINLYGIYITAGDSYIDLSPLAQLPNIDTVSLSTNIEQDLSPLNNNEIINDFRLYLYGDIDNKSNFYETISTLSNLQHFEIQDNYGFDLNCLKDLEQLNYLEINSNLNIDYYTISEISGLQTLKVYTNNITNYEDIEQLNNLENLSDFYLSDSHYDSGEGLLNVLDSLNVTNLELQKCFEYDIGAVENNNNIQINYTDIPILNRKLDSNSKHYTESFNLLLENDYNNENKDYVVFDDENKTITIDISNIRNRYIDLGIYDGDNSCTSSNLKITWEFDDDNEIVELDDRIKSQLTDYDTNEDGQYTIRELSDVRYLYINANGNTIDLSGVEKITNLENINLYNFKNGSNCNSLKELSNLNSVTISNGDLDFSFLVDIDNLKNLNLYYIYLENYMNIVSGLTDLEELSIYTYSNSLDLTTLQNLNNLNGLHLFNYGSTPIICENLNSISNFNKLLNLELNNIYFNDYTWLGSLTNLEELGICVNEDSIISENIISKLTKVNKLNVNHVNNNLEWINDFSNLNSLTVNTYNSANLNEDVFELLDDIEVDHIYINGIVDIYLGELENNKQYEFYINELPILKEFENANSKFYIEGYGYYLNDPNEDRVIIDNINNTIKVTPKEDKANYCQIYNSYSCSINLKWINPGDNDPVNLSNKIKQYFEDNNIIIDSNGDGIITKGELKSITKDYISIYFNRNEDVDLTGIEYIKSLNELYLGLNNNSNCDLSNLVNLNNLTKLTLSSINKDTDISFINNLNSLQYLNIYVSYNYNQSPIFDGSILNGCLELEELYLSGYTDFDFSKCNNYQTLKKISLQNGTFENLEFLSLFTNIDTLVIGSQRNNTLPMDVDSIKSLNNLKILDIFVTPDLNWICELDNLEKIYLRNQYQDSLVIDRILDLKEKIGADFYLRGTYYIDLGYATIGNNRVINIDDIPFLNLLMNSESDLYTPNLNVTNPSSSGSYYSHQYIQIDKNSYTITITPNTFGEKRANYYTSSNYNEEYKFEGTLYFTWFNLEEGDRETEIQFNDINLKNALLEKYDFDKNEKITEYDMKNLYNPDLSSKGISDITGLENAINASYIYLDNNQIRDISPIEELSENVRISLNHNYITDLSNLTDANFMNINICNNYIDFSDNSNNTKIVKDSIAKYDDEEYVEIDIEWFVNHFKYNQKLETPETRNDVLNFSENVVNRLKQYGIDVNNDSKITKGELSDYQQNWGSETLDLSNLEISDLNNFKYLNDVMYIDLSNNNITDFSPLSRLNPLRELSLSNNNITSIDSINDFLCLNKIDLSNNKIKDISSLSEIYKECIIDINSNSIYSGGEEPFIIDLNLSNNEISNVDVLSNLRFITKLNLSNNNIKDISSLSNFDFDVYGEWFGNYEYGIDLSNNYIDTTSTMINNIKNNFEENEVYLILDNQMANIPDLDVEYRTYVQKEGWQAFVSNGAMSGTSGKGLRLEGIQIKLGDTEISGDIEYRTHVQKEGWQAYVKNGQLSGTKGKALRLEAINIRLTGDLAEYYDIYYRVHAQKFGWMGWAKNGESAGTAAFGYRLEGIQIKIVKKGDPAPGSSQNRFKQNIKYQTHVQKEGWQDLVNSGEMSGTSGKGLRLEGIKIKAEGTGLKGNVEYRTHVQKLGWQNFVRNGEMSGTSGQGLRLEAIQIKLTDQMAENYDIYYRVHAQKFGWMGWAKNGESAGTAGFGYRLEGIQIQLVLKGDPAPGSTENAFRKNK